MRLDVAGREFRRYTGLSDLVELVQRDEGRFVLTRLDAGDLEQPRQHLAVIHQDLEIGEAQVLEHLADRRDLLGLDNRRRGTDRIDIALIELAKPPSRGPIGTPDGLNLVA